MTLLELLRKHHVPLAGGDNKHSRPGWIQLKTCPFCRDSGGHLGIADNGVVNCYKCGRHRLGETLAQILGISVREAIGLTEDWRPSRGVVHTEAPTRSRLLWPAGMVKMGDLHRRYLSNRGFDPEKLEDEWDLMATGPMGPLKYRIVIPVIHGHQAVCWQARDATGKAKVRYMTCPDEHARMTVKQTLYGAYRVPGRTVVVVEGVTDVWRLGAGAVCTYGIEWSSNQIALLKQYHNVYVLFDNETRAQRQAEKLGNILALGAHVKILRLDGKDPGDMAQDEADSLMDEIIGRRS